MRNRRIYLIDYLRKRRSVLGMSLPAQQHELVTKEEEEEEGGRRRRRRRRRGGGGGGGGEGGGRVGAELR